MFTVARSAWSSVGVDVSDARNAWEACNKAGLDWTVEKESMRDQWGEVQGYKALRRSDNGFLLSVMRDSYTPVNNLEVFSVLDPFIREGSLVVDTATELEGGRKVVLNFKIKDLIGDVSQDDPVQGYLNAYNAHDGSLALGFGFHPYRLWCMNQQPRAMNYMARSGWDTNGAISIAHDKRAMKFRHTRSVNANIKRVTDVIDLTKRQFNTTLEELRHLTTVDCNTALFRRVIEMTYANQMRLAGYKQPEELHFYDRLLHNFEAGVGYEAHGGSLYGVVQAVSEYHTHQAGRSTDEIERARKRLNALWFGTGDQMIARAHEICLGV
ncbi:DUF932 domain-containing protein [Synechococcus elongatus IITB4]|uniref:DUF932 domain-containing protein n=1 Tax=Synechococcus elongatus TaxID=32046 RepID=UPI0030D04816